MCSSHTHLPLGGQRLNGECINFAVNSTVSCVTWLCVWIICEWLNQFFHNHLIIVSKLYLRALSFPAPFLCDEIFQSRQEQEWSMSSRHYVLPSKGTIMILTSYPAMIFFMIQSLKKNHLQVIVCTCWAKSVFIYPVSLVYFCSSLPDNYACICLLRCIFEFCLMRTFSWSQI